jgi:hypothetical protein
MSTLKVGGIRGVSASSDAITVANDGTCSANVTSINGGQLSNRNMIINGAINISQRKGTTQTTVPHDTSFYSVDRFAIFDKIDGGNNFTYQQTTAPVPDGFEYALKINTAIADSSISAANYAFFYQIVEGDNIQQANLGTSAAKPLTLSFHVYSNKTGTYTVGLVNQGTFNRTFLKEFTISSSGVWEKKTITFPAITDGTWGDVRVQWALAVGSDHQGAADTLLTSTKLGTSNQVNLANNVNNSFHITGVQLEVGSVATDFEHRSFGQELLLCQRYYAVAGVITATDNDHRRHNNVSLPVDMRTSPTRSVGAIETGSGATMAPNYEQGLANSKRHFYQGTVNSAISGAWFIFEAEL